jgi:hypothetical protein
VTARPTKIKKKQKRKALFTSCHISNESGTK